jgi:hypothetical protein
MAARATRKTTDQTSNTAALKEHSRQCGLPVDTVISDLVLQLAAHETPKRIATSLGVSVARVLKIIGTTDLPLVVGTTSSHLRDLRSTLVHEHGHRIVAAHYKIPGRIAVSLNREGRLFDRHYVGEFQLCGRMPTPRSERLVGLAGAIANLIDDEPEIDHFEIIEYLPDSTLSPTDRRLAGAYLPSDIERTLMLLRRYWPQLLAAVERDLTLVQGGQPTR